MKATILSKTLFLFLLIPTVILASTNPEAPVRHKKEKTIKKSFIVNADATFGITNRYGNIDIVTWNENRIEVEVNFSVEGSNEDKVIKKLNQLDVAIQSAPQKVTLITAFD